MNVLNELIEQIRVSKFYIPRGYQTIGGMWPVDTWRRGPVAVKVIDGGYTQQVIAEDLFVTVGYNGKEYVCFEKGGQKQVEKYLKDFLDNVY